MPTLKPFRGLRYTESAELRDLVCPPYDIISSREQGELHARHPHNAVRLELASRSAAGADYSSLSDTVDEWMTENVLAREAKDSFYVYRQDFIRPGTGDRAHVTGIIGALRLEDFGTGVLPHERTMEGPKADRLALLRSIQMNVSPIYAIYRGGGDLGPFFGSLENRPPAARFQDETGILHRLWLIGAPAEIEMLGAAVQPGPLVIADGHHRYETALAFHREQVSPGEHDSIMCFCVDADSEDLVVLPYNRAIKGSVDLGVPHVVGETSSPETALQESKADHPFVLITESNAYLAEIADEEVVAITGERAPAWRALDVVALHEVLLPALMRGDPDEIAFSRDPQEVSRLVRQEGWSLGVLLRSLDARQVVEVASSGERMPQKASYFWPKALTGLVFRTLREP